MNQNSLNKSRLKIQAGAVFLTRDLVHARTRELALLSGRTAQEVSQADYEQAKCELTGESDLDRQDAIMHALPETAAPG